MRYLRIETSIDGPSQEPGLVGHLLLGALRALLPCANPDLDELMVAARFWWLEIDESGAPVREIGFSASGDPIVLGPVGRNMGYLVDSSDDWSSFTCDCEEAKKDFDSTWQALLPRFLHLEHDLE